MNVNTKKRLTVALLLGLAAYCGYESFLSVKEVLSDPKNLAYFSFEFWAFAVIAFVGIGLYAWTALSVLRVNLNDKQIYRLQIFSGIFSGGFTNILWFWLLNANATVTNWYYWIAQACLVSVVVFAAAIAVTPLPGWKIELKRLKRLFLAFAVTALLFAAIQLGRKLGIANVDPLLLLAGGVFLVFAYFFPKPAAVIAQTAIAGFTVMFAAIFAIVGGIFGNRRG